MVAGTNVAERVLTSIELVAELVREQGVAVGRLAVALMFGNEIAATEMQLFDI
jgi:hypothetical protein